MGLLPGARIAAIRRHWKDKRINTFEKISQKKRTLSKHKNKKTQQTKGSIEHKNYSEQSTIAGDTRSWK